MHSFLNARILGKLLGLKTKNSIQCFKEEKNYDEKLYENYDSDYTDPNDSLDSNIIKKQSRLKKDIVGQDKNKRLLHQ